MPNFLFELLALFPQRLRKISMMKPFILLCSAYSFTLNLNEVS